MKTALEYFRETERVSTGTILRHYGYGTEAIQCLDKTPWYYMPYILSGRLSIAEMELKEDGWMHPVDLSKWSHPLHQDKN